MLKVSDQKYLIRVKEYRRGNIVSLNANLERRVKREALKIFNGIKSKSPFGRKHFKKVWAERWRVLYKSFRAECKKSNRGRLKTERKFKR